MYPLSGSSNVPSNVSKMFLTCAQVGTWWIHCSFWHAWWLHCQRVNYMVTSLKNHCGHRSRTFWELLNCWRVDTSQIHVEITFGMWAECIWWKQVDYIASNSTMFPPCNHLFPEALAPSLLLLILLLNETIHIDLQECWGSCLHNLENTDDSTLKFH